MLPLINLLRFSVSVAVMSMVGYILGLGDRHLDNILVDFCTGDVVHIDYNVCFDKGLRLKIPEIVPFRLTQTIQAALGLTGVEGTFRASCEAVMKALQNHKDLILMLLEVFIWDPLVEWMRGDGHDEATIGGEERKGMELAVSLSLFASRVQEIRVPLQVCAVLINY
jgi:PI-3-kinase-related kinase SMG-1